MSIDMAQLHQIFFEESFEGLDIMETGLMEAARDDDVVDEALVTETKKELDRLLSGEAASPATDGGTTASIPAEYIPTGWHVVFTPHRKLLTTGNDPVHLFREFSELGELNYA